MFHMYWLIFSLDECNNSVLVCGWNLSLLYITSVFSLFLQGVALYSEKLDSYLSNNSLINSSDIGGLGNGIACYTAADGSPSGAVWKTPDGKNIRTSGTSGATSLVFFTQERPQRVVLLRGGVEFSVVNEGVYTCRISDENGDTQTLFIGIYTPDNAGTYTIRTSVMVCMLGCCNSLPAHICRWSCDTRPCVLTAHWAGHPPLPVHHHLSLLLHPTCLHCLDKGWRQFDWSRTFWVLSSAPECLVQSLRQCSECEGWLGGGVHVWGGEWGRKEQCISYSARSVTNLWLQYM